MDRIVDRYHQVAEQCDAVVVVGSDYTDVGAPAEFAFNARVAANLGSPVLLVLNGNDREPRRSCAPPPTSPSPSSPPTTARLFAIIANRVTAGPELRAPRRCRATGVPAYAIPEEPLLARALGRRADGRLRRHAGQRRRVAAGARGARPGGRGDDAAATCSTTSSRARWSSRRATGPRSCSAC